MGWQAGYPRRWSGLPDDVPVDLRHDMISHLPDDIGPARGADATPRLPDDVVPVRGGADATPRLPGDWRLVHRTPAATRHQFGIGETKAFPEPGVTAWRAGTPIAEFPWEPRR